MEPVLKEYEMHDYRTAFLNLLSRCDSLHDFEGRRNNKKLFVREDLVKILNTLDPYHSISELDDDIIFNSLSKSEWFTKLEKQKQHAFTNDLMNVLQKSGAKLTSYNVVGNNSKQHILLLDRMSRYEPKTVAFFETWSDMILGHDLPYTTKYYGSEHPQYSISKYVTAENIPSVKFDTEGNPLYFWTHANKSDKLHESDAECFNQSRMSVLVLGTSARGGDQADEEDDEDAMDKREATGLYSLVATDLKTVPKKRNDIVSKTLRNFYKKEINFNLVIDTTDIKLSEFDITNSHPIKMLVTRASDWDGAKKSKESAIYTGTAEVTVETENPFERCIFGFNTFKMKLEAVEDKPEKIVENEYIMGDSDVFTPKTETEVGALYDILTSKTKEVSVYNGKKKLTDHQLLDLKRTGDALQVLSVNRLNKEKLGITQPTELNIFVTVDHLAFLKAQMNGVPAIFSNIDKNTRERRMFLYKPFMVDQNKYLIKLYNMLATKMQTYQKAILNYDNTLKIPVFNILDHVYGRLLGIPELSHDLPLNQLLETMSMKTPNVLETFREQFHAQLTLASIFISERQHGNVLYSNIGTIYSVFEIIQNDESATEDLKTITIKSYRDLNNDDIDKLITYCNKSFADISTQLKTIQSELSTQEMIKECPVSKKTIRIYGALNTLKSKITKYARDVNSMLVGKGAENVFNEEKNLETSVKRAIELMYQTYYADLYHRSIEMHTTLQKTISDLPAHNYAIIINPEKAAVDLNKVKTDIDTMTSFFREHESLLQFLSESSTRLTMDKINEFFGIDERVYDTIASLVCSIIYKELNPKYETGFVSYFEKKIQELQTKYIELSIASIKDKTFPKIIREKLVMKHTNYSRTVAILMNDINKCMQSLKLTIRDKFTRPILDKVIALTHAQIRSLPKYKDDDSTHSKLKSVTVARINSTYDIILERLEKLPHSGGTKTPKTPTTPITRTSSDVDMCRNESNDESPASPASSASPMESLFIKIRNCIDNEDSSNLSIKLNGLPSLTDYRTNWKTSKNEEPFSFEQLVEYLIHQVNALNVNRVHDIIVKPEYVSQYDNYVNYVKDLYINTDKQVDKSLDDLFKIAIIVDPSFLFEISSEFSKTLIPTPATPMEEGGAPRKLMPMPLKWTLYDYHKRYFPLYASLYYEST